MAFAVLEDYNGEIEVTFFSGAWEKCAGVIENDKVAILKGKIEHQKDKGRTSFLADEYLAPETAEAAAREEETKARKWEKYRNAWKYMADLKLDKAAQAEKGNYTVIGLLKSLREITDKKGNKMAFGVLQDYSGEIDLVFFSSVWKDCKDFIVVDEMTALKGTIDPKNDKNPAEPSFKISSVPDLGRLIRAAARKAAAEPERAGGDADAGIPDDELAAGLAPAGAIAVYDESGAEDAFFAATFPDADYSEDDTDDAAGGSGDAATAPPVTEFQALPEIREYHVRLAANPGGAALLIHVPVSQGEKVIRSASGIGCAVDALSGCAEVAEAWAR
jgi:DNA polymerase-3 subunit alpha